MMRAVLLRRHGSVDGLVLADVPKPSPHPNEVLVKVHAATLTRGDVVVRRLPGVLSRLFKLGRKTVLGHEFAGKVEAVGHEVTRFNVGDRVFGSTTGLRQGSHAEYICVPDTGILATVPATIELEEAAAVPIGGLTALYFLRRANIADGKTVLVYGASGSVGTYAVQLAAHFGTEVTGVCSAANAELVRSLGAKRVIDYTSGDFTDGGTYDIVFDAVGKSPARRSKSVLAKGGAYVSVRSTTAKERTEDLVLLRGLLEAGELRAVIDRRYPLEQVREAHRYVETGRKRGNVIITIASSTSRAGPSSWP
jgi:NADPH:quinone reductase-like Zn-dependent oxidoreductase